MSLLEDLDPPRSPVEPPAVVFESARYAAQGKGYELSSKGDTRFSALYARLGDGRSIEEAYQLDVKGFRAQSNNWRSGKGQAALNGKDYDQLWCEYLDLWRTWSQENPALIEDLRSKAQGKILTDCFASSPISQARALSIILNETAQPQQSASKKPRP